MRIWYDESMKKYNIIMVGIGFFAVFGMALSASAAGVILTNGGFGQRSGETAHFGFAVCNGGTVAFSGNVPVTVSANNITQTITVASSIPVASCTYSYLPYATFNMVPGYTYSVSVTIDPQHSVITNTDNQITYAPIIVPSTSNGQVLGASTSATTETVQAHIAELQAQLIVLLQKLVTILQSQVTH
jgi:hypothetical protein